MNIQIIKANITHCSDLSIVKQKCWRETYTGIYSEDEIENFDYDKHLAKFFNDITDANQNVFTVKDNFNIIGYMIFGKSKHPFNNIEYELNALYLLESHQGLGIGKKLFDLAIETAKTLKQNEFLINCNYYNPSNNFYSKMGANLIGTTDSDIKAEKQNHYLYKIN